MRELLFHKRVNIAKRENLLRAAEESGLNIQVFLRDLDGQGRELFEADLKFAADLNVDLFPTYIMTSLSGKRARLAGFISYDKLSATIDEIL